jgi:hypothetical protein
MNKVEELKNADRDGGNNIKDDSDYRLKAIDELKNLPKDDQYTIHRKTIESAQMGKGDNKRC